MRSWTPKAKRRQPKPYTSGLTPAQIIEYRQLLNHAMELGTKGGRPKLVKQKALAKLRRETDS